ncbi:hypothetical protein [Micromonospora palythoicola]|uniref:hypothetical protein n=1 Tax=Micromonospora palythoicola TaxID=3120507 RepID=UPI002FCE054A
MILPGVILTAAAQTGDVHRRCSELAVLVDRRDGLRSGDGFVPDSRRHADPALFLPRRRGRRSMSARHRGRRRASRPALG